MHLYPLKFLDAYTAADQQFFFGRDEEIEKLFTACTESSLVLLYGASGAGKTSLVQCGLAKKLYRHSWCDIYIRRGEDINRSLEEGLRKAAPEESESSAAAKALLRKLYAKKHQAEGKKTISPILDLVKSIYQEHFSPIYIIFDQFEELFLLGTEDEQVQFYAQVNELLSAEQEVKLIFSIREEFLGHLYAFEQAVPDLFKHRVRVEGMNLKRVASVLGGINALDNSVLSFAEGEEALIAEALMRKLSGHRKVSSISLPYLQVILDKLYRDLNGGNEQQLVCISLKDVESLPAIDDIMRDFLDERMQVITGGEEENKERLWTLLSGLVTLEGTKVPKTVALLQQELDLDQAYISQSLDQLERNRILRYREEDNVYELAHDSLALSVAEKRSGDEKERLRIKAYLSSVMQMDASLQEPLSMNWLARIEPLLVKLRLTKEELAYVQKSQRYQQEQQELEIRRLKEQQEVEKRRLREQQEAEKARLLQEAETKRRELEAEKEVEKRVLEAEKKALEERKQLETRALRSKLTIAFVSIVAIIFLCVYAFYASYQRGQALEVKNRVLSNIDFYKGRFGLTVKKDSVGQFRYGYMDRDGQVKLDYQYTEARPFMRNGFARVKIDGALYLIDTLGKRYPLAESVRGITDSTLAVNLEEQLLDEVPKEVLKNKQVEVLFMSGNKLKSLPKKIEQLSALRIVDLSYNKLTGELPAVLSKLEDLEQLDLSSNALQAANMDSGFEQLRELDLSKNELDTFSNTSGVLANLEQLNLYKNKLKSIGGLKGVKGLKVLNVSENSLTSITSSETKEFVGVEELNLYKNQLVEASAVGGLSSLKRLNVASNPLNKQTGEALQEGLSGNVEVFVDVIEEESKEEVPSSTEEEKKPEEEVTSSTEEEKKPEEEVTPSTEEKKPEEQKEDLGVKELEGNRIKDLRDNEVYKTVQIGNQIWMSENMRYNVSGSQLNPKNPNKKYGRLYTWNQAMKACPSGWHLPSDEEWKELERYLGMLEEEVNDNKFFRGNIGRTLKSTSGWKDSGNGSNSSGFNALPAGYYSSGSFSDLGEGADFWSSTDAGLWEESSDYFWFRGLYGSVDGVARRDNDKLTGHSCRCLKNNGESKTSKEDKKPEDEVTPSTEEEKKPEENKEDKDDQSLGTFKDERDNEVYKTVQIGNQTWMSENMRYNVSGSHLNPNNPNKEYGRLYTWKQALGVCPKGWHLPSDEEWKEMERYLGMSESDVNNTGFRGDIGGKLKSTGGWYSKGNGSNSSGFNALPAGSTYSSSVGFDDLGKNANFWSSTEKSSVYAWYRTLLYYDGKVSRRDHNKSYAYSCRCLKN